MPNLSYVDSAEYRYVYNHGSTSYTKTVSGLTAPFVVKGSTIGSGTTDQYQEIFLYTLPDECKMKKSQITISINYTANVSSNEFGVSFYAIDNTSSNIFTSDRFSYTNVYNDTQQSNQINNTSFKSSTSGTKSRTATTDAYITLGNYIAAVFFTGDQASVGQITINSFTISYEVLDDFNIITPTYPVNINIKNTSASIFTWERSNTLPNTWPYSNYVASPIFKHSIVYKVKGTGTEYTLTENDSNTYQNVAANTFNVDTYLYRIVDYTYYDLAIYSDWIEFNAIGINDAPTINSVSDDNIPTVSWTDSNQAAFEVRIKNTNQTIVYYSGMIAGNDQSYQITEMLDNGTYIVEVRELNTYGFYSDWGSLEFTINPATVSAPTDIFATVNNQYGVEISGTPAVGAQSTYVIRRKVGETDFTIIGIYTGGIYTDYTAEGNVFYEYSLRNYNVGYADGELIPLQVKVKEVVIQDGRDLTNYLDLSLSDEIDFNSRWIEEKDRTLYNCLGRIYPVKEPGEWVNSSRTFTAFVNESDRSKLHDLNLNAPKVYYKADKEYFACDMTIEDEGPYISGGRLVTFTLTRIADDEGVSII